MVFKRRNTPGAMQRIRDAIYPRRGWRRGIEYLGHRIKRLPDTPHKIALGIAVGVFVSFTPFFGVHFVVAIVLAWALRGNVLASFIGTFIGNPLTFPFIATLSLSTGRRILGMGEHHGEFVRVKDAFVDAFGGIWQSFKAMFGYGSSAWDRLSDFWYDVFIPYFVGGLLPGLISAIVIYFVARPLIAAYQQRRRMRLVARAKERLAQRQIARQARPAE